jgi:hypothetical protein
VGFNVRIVPWCENSHMLLNVGHSHLWESPGDGVGDAVVGSPPVLLIGANCASSTFELLMVTQSAAPLMVHQLFSGLAFLKYSSNLSLSVYSSYVRPLYLPIASTIKRAVPAQKYKEY